MQAPAREGRLQWGAYALPLVEGVQCVYVAKGVRSLLIDGPRVQSAAYRPSDRAGSS